jgi:LIVCS family branched-chain amino acid:cation transporter
MMSDYISAAIAEKNPAISEKKIVIYTGLALFAMFFGAGNIVFPLYLGANCGSHILVSLLGFLLAGVGVPFLGLMAISLYHGDYFAFFARLGKVPALMMITLLMLALGPLGAMPRTETTTFNTLLPYLPDALKENAVFSIFYCGLALILAYRETKIIKILGLFLSPVKIVAFSTLVFIGLLFTEGPIFSDITAKDAFHEAISYGYNTMDLLAGILFCTIAFRSIQLATKKEPRLNPASLTLKACMLGAFIISMVYTGFMLVAYNHANALQGLGAEQTISAISHAVLGKFGGIFVCIAVSFACFATTLALGQACSQCLYQDILRSRIPKYICITVVFFATYLMSTLGFKGVSEVIAPIVNIIYPALIVHCILSILHKWKGVKIIKLPVFFTILASTWYTLF